LDLARLPEQCGSNAPLSLFAKGLVAVISRTEAIGVRTVEEALQIAIFTVVDIPDGGRRTRNSGSGG
jgi:hypothetical protein